MCLVPGWNPLVQSRVLRLFGHMTPDTQFGTLHPLCALGPGEVGDSPGLEMARGNWNSPHLPVAAEGKGGGNLQEKGGDSREQGPSCSRPISVHARVPGSLVCVHTWCVAVCPDTPSCCTWLCAFEPREAFEPRVED